MVSQPRALVCQDAGFDRPLALSGTLRLQPPNPRPPGAEASGPALAGYLRGRGSRPLPGTQEAVHGAAAGWGGHVRGQLWWGNSRGRGAAGRSEQLLEAGTQPSSGGASLLLAPTSLGHPPT